MPMVADDKDRYFRAGIAIRLDRKPIFDERMKQIGLKTTGDLVNLIVTADESIVPALKVYADQFISYRERAKSGVTKKDLLREFKSLEPTVMAELLAKHKAEKDSQGSV